MFSQEQIFITSGTELRARQANHCVTTLIGDMGRSFQDIALTPNGNLYGSTGSQLYQINTANASTTLIAAFSPGAENANALEALDNNTLVCELGKWLYKINISDASLTPVGFLNYESNGDIAWYDNSLYMTTQNNKLIRITLNEDNTALTSVVNVTPTTSIPSYCEGLITVQHEDFLENVLLAFCGGYVYEICPIDGSSTFRCYEYYAPGAAATRLAPQTPLLTECPVELNTSSIGDIISRVTITPNPASKDDEINIQIPLSLHNSLNISLINVHGQLLFESGYNIFGSNASFNLKSLNIESGNYILKIDDGRSSAFSKLIVN